jgi:hypothetical protein
MGKTGMVDPAAMTASGTAVAAGLTKFLDRWTAGA